MGCVLVMAKPARVAWVGTNPTGCSGPYHAYHPVVLVPQSISDCWFVLRGGLHTCTLRGEHYQVTIHFDKIFGNNCPPLHSFWKQVRRAVIMENTTCLDCNTKVDDVKDCPAFLVILGKMSPDSILYTGRFASTVQHA